MTAATALAARAYLLCPGVPETASQLLPLNRQVKCCCLKGRRKATEQASPAAIWPTVLQESLVPSLCDTLPHHTAAALSHLQLQQRASSRCSPYAAASMALQLRHPACCCSAARCRGTATPSCCHWSAHQASCHILTHSPFGPPHLLHLSTLCQWGPACQGSPLHSLTHPKLSRSTQLFLPDMQLQQRAQRQLQRVGSPLQMARPVLRLRLVVQQQPCLLWTRRLACAGCASGASSSAPTPTLSL